MSRRAFTVVEVVIVVAVVGVILSMCWSGVLEARRNEARRADPQYAVYEAWARTYRSQLTFEEWTALRQHGARLIP